MNRILAAAAITVTAIVALLSALSAPPADAAPTIPSETVVFAPQLITASPAAELIELDTTWIIANTPDALASETVTLEPLVIVADGIDGVPVELIEMPPLRFVATGTSQPQRVGIATQVAAVQPRG